MEKRFEKEAEIQEIAEKKYRLSFCFNVFCLGAEQKMKLIVKNNEISDEEKIKKFQEQWNSEYENVKIQKPENK